MLLTVREKEVYGKLYSLVDQIISHRGKEGSVVKELVIERLVLKKEREERKKERKTIDFRFFSPPFIFVQVHFPKDSSRISHVSRIRSAREFQGMRRIDFSFFLLVTAFTNRVNHAYCSRY